MAKFKNALDVAAWVNALQEHKAIAIEAGKAAVYDFASEILTQSLFFVPKETGALGDSGKVHPPQESGAVITCEITFGNGEVTYAAAVHERLDAYHQPPTRAKFLEITMRSNENRFFEFVTSRIQAAVSKAGGAG